MGCLADRPSEGLKRQPWLAIATLTRLKSGAQVLEQLKLNRVAPPESC